MQRASWVSWAWWPHVPATQLDAGCCCSWSEVTVAVERDPQPGRFRVRTPAGP